ncbi:glycosyltransferase family 39 protein [Arthrobacter sp. NPDC093128]|uniref:glycosyltransferase family 39 protein n=1 Tax=Arthrobacter sp. NPDC093128 TaxID=3154979 RepID=UPI003436741F
MILLLSNAALNFSNLQLNGWANSFYSAAVQAGTMDSKAFFFGSSDWGNSITVDKPPLSLWIMGVSVRLFGLSPEAMLAPQAAMGLLTTLVIYLLVRRHFTGTAALVAAAVFATTPIITLMSRYNNPDPLMLLLMTASAYLVVRAVETGRTGFFVAAGAAIGLAFMTKQLQGLLSLPALASSFLCFSGLPWSKRLRAAIAGLGAMVVTGGLWMTIVDLVPPGSRPYVGGSSGNSVLQLTLGYNGIDRIISKEKDPLAVMVPEQFRSVESDAGFLRLLNTNYSQESAWLLIAALLGAVLVILSWKHVASSRGARALILISLVWFVTAYVVLSFMGDQIHTYYTAALAPPLALTAGLVTETIARRRTAKYRVMSSLIALTGVLTSWLILNGLERWPSWSPTAVLCIGVISVSIYSVRAPWPILERMAGMAIIGVLLLGPTVTSIYNVNVPHNGSNPVSGVLTKNQGSISHFLDQLKHNDPAWAHDIAFGREPSRALTQLFSEADDCTWAGATYASQTAARLQLAAGRPIMPIGGFAGTDPSPTLEEFQMRAADGEVCYFIQQESYLAVQSTQTSATKISNWVQANYLAETVDGTTIYNLNPTKTK